MFLYPFNRKLIVCLQVYAEVGKQMGASYNYERSKQVEDIWYWVALFFYGVGGN